MNIIEKRLRNYIECIIQEIKVPEDHDLLTIDGPMSGTGFDRYDRKAYTYQKNERVLQLFKAWCNKNDISGKSPEDIVSLFKKDYDYNLNARNNNNIRLRDELMAHAELASSLPKF